MSIFHNVRAVKGRNRMDDNEILATARIQQRDCALASATQSSKM